MIQCDDGYRTSLARWRLNSLTYCLSISRSMMDSEGPRRTIAKVSCKWTPRTTLPGSDQGSPVVDVLLRSIVGVCIIFIRFFRVGVFSNKHHVPTPSLYMGLPTLKSLADSAIIFNLVNNSVISFCCIFSATFLNHRFHFDPFIRKS